MRKAHIFGFLMSLMLLTVNTFAGIEHGAAENNDNTDNTVIIARINSNDIEVTVPSVIYTFTDTHINLKFKKPEHTRLLYNNNKVNFIINGEDVILSFINGECDIKRRFTTSDNAITIYAEEFSYKHSITPISLWYIIIPVVLVIALTVIIIIRKQKHSNS
jgi:hypothetical protein